MLLFFSLVFQAVLIVYISLHLTLCTVQPNIAGEPPSPPNLSCFFEEYPPLCRVAASGQVSPFRCSSHLSSEYPSLFYVFFACKTQFPPGRSRLASLSTNIICRIFFGMGYFLRIFLRFFLFFLRIIPSKI